MTPTGRITPALALCFSLLASCASDAAGGAVPSQSVREAIADTLRAKVREAYDLSKGDPVRRFMSLYPAEGRIVSATGGRVSTTRDSLQASINAFWDGVGQHMVRPTWTWTDMQVDVVSRDAAVMTASYLVPHWTDVGRPHVIGGVWTSVWQRQTSGWRIVHEHLSDMPRAMAERMEATMPGADSTIHQGHGTAK
jgi:ketosteroid isomerase-like protein